MLLENAPVILDTKNIVATTLKIDPDGYPNLVRL